MISSQVLVVGAGPAGLTTALALARQGIRCRVVERGTARRTGTGCHMLWPRTLEALDGAGLDVAELARHGVTVERKAFHLGEKSFSHSMADPHSLWPFPVSVEQEVLEEALTRRLEQHGVRIERGVEAVRVTRRAAGVGALLRHASGQEEAAADWLVLAQGEGADLRDALGFRMEAEPPPAGHIVHLNVELPAGAGLDATTERIYLGGGASVGLVPLPGGRHRLFAVLGEEAGPTAGPPTWSEVADTVGALTGVGAGVRDLGQGWRFVPRHAIAASFRSGRCLLVGESAKSAPMPVHGMNGGIQDAFNLAWKLGAVVRGEVGPWLLDTYSAERRAVAADAFAQARKILAYGTAADAEATHGERVRKRRHDVRTQPPLRYRGGPLTHDGGPMPGPREGEHLPDAPLLTVGGVPGTLLRHVIGGFDWTMLVLAGVGAREAGPAAVAAACAAGAAAPRLRTLVVRGSRLQSGPPAFGDPDGAVHQAFGAAEPRVYLVRPDGHIGYRGPLADLDGLRSYLRGVFGERARARG